MSLSSSTHIHLLYGTAKQTKKKTGQFLLIKALHFNIVYIETEGERWDVKYHQTIPVLILLSCVFSLFVFFKIYYEPTQKNLSQAHFTAVCSEAVKPKITLCTLMHREDPTVHKIRPQYIVSLSILSSNRNGNF